MKSTGMRLVFEIVFPVFALVLCLGAFVPAIAEAPAADDSVDKYSAEELEEIVGPVALYPDIVLSSLLPASTFPNDVADAAKWANSQTEAIEEVPEDSGWDESVEAMVQYPDVLVWMSENMDWMEMLAYAVSVQQEDVLQAIQDYRAACEDAGNLESDEHMQVVQEGETIYIQPASPEVVYVPTYDPYAVRQPGYSWGAWGAGFAMGAVGAWAVHSIGWGHHGHGGSININNSRHYNFNNNGKINTGNIGSGNNWNSNNRPRNRPNERPGQTKPNRGNWDKKAGKNRPGKGGVKPGNDRPGGKRPGSRPGDRPGGDRPGSKPGGNRPGSKPGSKPGADRPGSKPGSKPGGKPGAKPGGKPSTRPSKSPSKPKASKGSKSTMSGSKNHGRSTKQASSRGKKSMSSKPKSSSRSSSRSGSSRSGSRGGSRGGGGRGGGGRRR